MAKMRGPRFKLSTAFYVANIAIFFLGAYYWIVHSTFRIMMLYSLFSACLFWLSGSHQKEVSGGQVRLGSTLKWLGLSALILSTFVIFALSQSLYQRPGDLSIVMGIVLVLLIVMQLAESRVNDNVFFLRPWFLLGLLTFVVLYAEFSIYVVQPNLMNGPAYATADAYRDYANAARVLELSGFDPGQMVGEQYYRVLPIVPIQIAMTTLVTGLPVNIAHLTVAVPYAILAVISLTLLTRLSFKWHAQLPAVAFLSVLVVVLQPVLIDPNIVLKPLVFTIPLISLVLYLSFSSMSRGQTNSYYLVIVLLTSIIVPMHPTSAVMIGVLFASMALIFRRDPASRSILQGLVIILLVFLMLYLVSSTGALGSSLSFLRVIYITVHDILQAGPSFLNRLGAIGTMGPSLTTAVSSVKADEFNEFLTSVPPALILAIATVASVRLVKDKKENAQRGFLDADNEKNLTRRNIRSFCLFAALLLLMGYGVGYVLASFAAAFSNILLITYLIFPLTPLALLTTNGTLTRVRINTNTVRRLMLVGLLAFYAISVVTSSAFVHENSPFLARLIPTQSERVAASFLSRRYDVASGVQILTDPEFLGLVQGELYAQHLSVGENRFYIDTLSLNQPMNHTKTIMLLRVYFTQNAWMKGPESPLSDAKKWVLFNRIFDDSSTSIYSGTLP